MKPMTRERREELEQECEKWHAGHQVVVKRLSKKGECIDCVLREALASDAARAEMVERLRTFIANARFQDATDLQAAGRILSETAE